MCRLENPEHIILSLFFFKIEDRRTLNHNLALKEYAQKMPITTTLKDITHISSTHSSMCWDTVARRDFHWYHANSIDEALCLFFKQMRVIVTSHDVRLWSNHLSLKTYRYSTVLSDYALAWKCYFVVRVGYISCKVISNREPDGHLCWTRLLLFSKGGVNQKYLIQCRRMCESTFHQYVNAVQNIPSLL